MEKGNYKKNPIATCICYAVFGMILGLMIGWSI